MHDIPVRKMDFHFPERIDPVFVPGQPERSFLLVGLSLLLPYLEPYLIRTMKAARKHVSNPDLLADLDHFSAQESQHYQQHKRFNDAMHLEGFDELAHLEAELEADYRRFSKEKSLAWNLAYAEGFEAFTTATACFSFERGEMFEMTPQAAELWGWHLIEELEHRTVAFEVYDHVCGSYWYRLVHGGWAQWHMLRFCARVAGSMLEQRPDIVEACGGEAAMQERMRVERRRALTGLLPRVLKTYLPWYTPARIEFTPEMRQLAAAMSEKAVAHL